MDPIGLLRKKPNRPQFDSRCRSNHLQRHLQLSNIRLRAFQDQTYQQRDPTPIFASFASKQTAALQPALKVGQKTSPNPKTLTGNFTVSRANEGDDENTSSSSSSSSSSFNIKVLNSNEYEILYELKYPHLHKTPCQKAMEEMHLNAFITYHWQLWMIPKTQGSSWQDLPTHLPIDREWFLHGHTVDDLNG